MPPAPTLTPLPEAEAQFRALADATRLRVLNLLTAGELCVCDLVAILGLPQSTVSRHLAALLRAGLVRVTHRGRFAYYRMADPDGGLRRGLGRVVRDAHRTVAGLARERAAAARAVAARAARPCE